MIDKRQLHRYVEWYLGETRQILDDLDQRYIDALIQQFIALKNRTGRLFIIGNGGSAANASHAVNDFRKICGIEAYTPTDNVAELTARTNDEGWESVFHSWLSTSHLNSQDVLLVLSVGGGTLKTSYNLVDAIQLAKDRKATVLGIVSQNGGFTLEHADVCILIPIINKETVTPHAEELQSILLHLIVNHPELKC